MVELNQSANCKSQIRLGGMIMIVIMHYGSSNNGNLWQGSHNSWVLNTVSFAAEDALPEIRLWIVMFFLHKKKEKKEWKKEKKRKKERKKENKKERTK